ncbi:tRNA-intron endonuclease catalytic domain-like superfamily protein [Babesia bigemina]|uniref:tRNA-intron lyase n=1 Tax=Babesia bigemina TaxID=5866 RepID=A0A061D0Q0_BABBI|nr:tRNA-intron endonuclease catalytic domain-like superfamily protein [Babesia bigemina]CDR94376.1 tRNA-intron endonuclease catalytic domain-like superfamily protein [Babesia bigemina]|eukprot:XP_012766562.1 tRNA-intron endonuclease catalytic domain-like superfamily protein [Babesia bigemina]
MCRDNSVVYRDLSAKRLKVKDGMHYGADLVIYEGDPRECHSYALIYVKHDGQEIPAQSVVRWTRVAAAAKKRVRNAKLKRFHITSQAILALVDCASATVKYASIDRLKLA